jgi:hypothetical protein
MSTTNRVILACPRCDRHLRVPTDLGDLRLTCPSCRFAWDWSVPIRNNERDDRQLPLVTEPDSAFTLTDSLQPSLTPTPETPSPLNRARELRSLHFRCANNGGRFQVVFGRVLSSHLFRVLLVLDDAETMDIPARFPSAQQDGAETSPSCSGSRPTAAGLRGPSRETTSFTSSDFDFSGWHCPCCGHLKNNSANDTMFVSCSRCHEYVCGGRVIEIPNGPSTYACHDGCGGSGRIEAGTGSMSSFDGTSIEHDADDSAAPEGDLLEFEEDEPPSLTDSREPN